MNSKEADKRRSWKGAVQGIAVLTAAAQLWSMSAMAHHSFGAYDMTKLERASGTLKEFRWGAPHAAVVLYIAGKNGEQQAVAFASAIPSSFVKQGIDIKKVRVGDKIELTWHPNRNGAMGGQIASITFADGKVFHDEEAAGFAPGGSPPGGSPAGPPSGPR